MPVAGKTGTTSATRAVWFAGFTPYYTCAVWAGYDTNEILQDDCKNFHKTLWKKVMSQIHENLPSAEFETPAGIKKATICAGSGLLAGLGCKVATEYFETSTVPTTRCMRHYVPPTPTPTPTPTLTPTPTPEVVESTQPGLVPEITVPSPTPDTTEPPVNNEDGSTSTQ